MKKAIFLSLAWIWIVTAKAQIIYVYHKTGKQPLAGITLISENPPDSLITNDDGMADISAMKGSQRIKIFYPGFIGQILSYHDLVKSMRIELDEDIINLGDFVVSATRWKQHANQLPQQIATINKETVAFQNPQTAADLLSLSGRVYCQKSQQGGGSPMIRGFATNRLLYSVDGVRMNTAIFRSGNIQNVINLDPFAMVKTEVLFGPGSVMYGSDAIGGVMSFETITPEFSSNGKTLIKGNATTRYATANKEKTGHLDLSFGWKKLALTSSISYWDFDHLRQGRNGPSDYLKNYFVESLNGEDKVVTQKDSLLQIPSAYAQINLMQKVRFMPTKSLDIQYGFHYSATSEYGRYDRHLRRRNGTARYAEWSYGPQKWMMNNLSISHTGNNGFYDQLTMRLAQQKFDESRIDRNLNNANRNTQTERVLAYSFNVDFIKTNGNKTWNYGLEYVLNDVVSTGLLTNILTETSVEGPARYPQAQWQSMGIFINQNYKVSSKTNLQAGLRYNYIVLDATFTTQFLPLPFTEAAFQNGALTGSIGAVFRPQSSWVLSANAATAFRSPNVDDMGKTFDSAPGTLTIPNPNIEAEYAYSFDIGLAKTFGEKLKVDLSAYYTILDNALVRRNFTLNGEDSITYDGDKVQVQAIQNAAVANVYGIQAGIEWFITKAFSFSSDINIQIGKEELDNGTKSPSRHASPTFGFSRLNYSLGKLRLQVYAQYMAERKFEDLPFEEQGKTEIYAKDANGKPYSPSWYTLNVKGMYHLGKKMTLTAGIENLTDQRYRPYSSGISAAGFNFMAGINASF